MKRLLAFLLCAGALIVCAGGQKDDIFDNKHISNVCIICSRQVDGDFAQVVQSGNQFYYYTNDLALASSVDDYDGIVLFFDGYNDLEGLAKDLKIDYFQGGQVEDNDCFYGYTPLYHDSVMVGKKRINAQIVKKEGSLVVGFPTILIGY